MIFDFFFLTANRSKKLKNCFNNISGTHKDNQKILTDLNSVGSKLQYKLLKLHTNSLKNKEMAFEKQN